MPHHGAAPLRRPGNMFRRRPAGFDKASMEGRRTVKGNPTANGGTRQQFATGARHNITNDDDPIYTGWDTPIPVTFGFRDN